MGTDTEWDARYAEAPSGIFSGNVNGTLAIEAADLRPGRALDVGCGEGADAIWLAPRPTGAPHGSPFTHDEVLRARRVSDRARAGGR